MPGDFVYDVSAPWDDLRSGVVQDRSGELWLWFPARNKEELKKPRFEVRLSDYKGQLRLQQFVGRHDGVVSLAALNHIYHCVLRRLRDAPDRKLPLPELQAALATEPGLDATLIDDVLRMMATMGPTEVRSLQSGLVYSLSDLMRSSFDEIDYLATFSEELIVKSRRIDLLLSHTGTMGSYREELFRALLTQILPQQYEATTGFIERCPRQLDIIVWDRVNFSPLFREQNFVVVPLAAVRAVIEVKTTLASGPLWQAMDILWDTFRNRQTPVPIFKGIFAYETDYASDDGIAARMKEFYASMDADGLIPHAHNYLWAGVNAVCVPKAHMIRERYTTEEGEAFPQPFLTGQRSDWPGDTQTPLFLGLLLTHLDQTQPAKIQTASLFNPVLRQLEDIDHGPIFPDWHPRSSLSEIQATLTAKGAQQYVRNVHAFRRGDLLAAAVGEGLAAETVSEVDAQQD